MGPQEKEEVRLRSARRGDNRPILMMPAAWDNRRSVRLSAPQGYIGLATATYSYQLTHEERCDVARRMAALWNLAAARGWTTDEIEASLPAPPAQGGR